MGNGAGCVSLSEKQFIICWPTCLPHHHHHHHQHHHHDHHYHYDDYDDYDDDDEHQIELGEGSSSCQQDRTQRAILLLKTEEDYDDAYSYDDDHHYLFEDDVDFDFDNGLDDHIDDNTNDHKGRSLSQRIRPALE